jgi:DNA polymerase-3 subunit epsilon
MLPGRQRSFDDLGTPLHDVTFCVIDLETTGATPDTCGITEIGAVKLRGGRCLGTFQTLVNPGRAIPPVITVLTGITESMVMPAPRIETVLPALLEFADGCVIVGHNVRFDLAFLAAACERARYPPLRQQSVDTCTLARRLVRDEVPDCRLGTLATRFRLDHRPSHRALDDALATGDLLHALLERAGRLGVTGLDDLLDLPRMAGHAQADKLRLTDGLPRAPGVYLFRDRLGDVLYVGKAANLRARVRSYFSTDERRKVPALLREAVRIDHQVCRTPLEAAVHEIRLIHRLQPRYNRQSKTWSRYAYLKLTLNERFPRLAVVRDARDDGGLYVGPLSSMGSARRAVEAIESVVPLRRCTARLTGRGAPPRAAPCAPAQLGVSTCPCAGTIGERAYDAHVQRTVLGLTTDPELLLAPLRARMEALASAERYEEAADVRDRAAALTEAMRRQRRIDGLRRAGRLVVEVEGHGGAVVVDGRLVDGWSGGMGGEPPPLTDAVPAGGQDTVTDAAGHRPTHPPRPDPGGAVAPESEGTPVAVVIRPERVDEDAEAPTARQPALPFGAAIVGSGHAGPCPRHLADEILCVARWLDREADRVRIVHCDGGLSSALPALGSFEPRRQSGSR